MAWGYWSATSVLPDRGRSPRRQATTSVPVSAAPAGPGLNSVGTVGGGENGAGGVGGTLPRPEALSRRSSVDVGISGPGGALAVVLCGGSGHTSRERGNNSSGNKFEFRHQEHCQLHQPALVECHHELSASEDEDTDPGYATGTSARCHSLALIIYFLRFNCDKVTISWRSYVGSIDWCDCIVNWKYCGWKRSWCNFSSYPSIGT